MTQSYPSVFYYMRCCRVWKLVYVESVGRCGLCHEHPETPSSKSEYDAQAPLIPPVDDFSPLSLLDDLPF